MKTYGSDVTGLMRDIGGSFMRCIAEAYERADRQNARKLELAFGDDFERYERALSAFRRQPQEQGE